MATVDERLKDEEYRHWVKAVLCLQYTKDGLVPFASRKSQDLHNAVLAQMRQSGNPSINGLCSTASIDFKRRTINCCANCNAFLVETKKHCTGTLNLNNFDIKDLHKQPWQLAKLFMNPGQDTTNTNPGQTDLSGILNFLDHCTLAKMSILNTANINAVKDTRNRILHTSDMKITKQDYSQKIIPTLIDLLQDPWFLSKDPDAQNAVAKINEVAAADFHITKENEEKILKDLATDVRCLCKDLNTKIIDLRTELNRVETNLGQEMKTEKDKLEKELQDREKDKETLKNLLQTLEQKVEDDAELVTKLSTDLSTIKTLLEQTRQDYKNLTAELRHIDETYELKYKQVVETCEQNHMQVEEIYNRKHKQVEEIYNRKHKQVEDTCEREHQQIEETCQRTCKQVEEKCELKHKQLEESWEHKQKHVEEKCERKHKHIVETCQRTHAEMTADIDDLSKEIKKTTPLWITDEDEAKLQQYLKEGYDNNKLDVPLLSTCHGVPVSEIFAPVILMDTKESSQAQRSECTGDEFAFWDEFDLSSIDIFNKDCRTSASRQIRDEFDLPASCGEFDFVDFGDEFDLSSIDIFFKDYRTSAPRQTTRERNKLCSYKALFFKENVLQKKIFLLGKAGAGKSTFCKHLTDIWCNDQVSPQFTDARYLKVFRYLFHVSCRFAEASESILDMIRNQLFCENDEMMKTTACEILKKKPDECLVLVDGIDEWKGSASKATGRRGDIPGLPSRKGLEDCVVLSTSRPERIHMLPTKLDKTCSILELQGIENAVDFIRSVLKKVEYPDPDMSCSEFLSQIEESNMTDLIRFPLMLINALNIWNMNETLSSSMCVNYSKMVEGLFVRAKLANRIEEHEQERKKETSPELPNCFLHTDLCKQNAGLILRLGKLAFHLLLRDDQNSSLIFSGQQTRKYLTEDELKICLAVGILSKAQTISRSIRKIDSFSFCHKTFQEFLGALWLSREQSQMQQFNSIGILFDNQILIQFLCGFLPSAGDKFWKDIAEEVTEKDQKIKQLRLGDYYVAQREFPWREYWFRAPRKVRFLQKLVLQCIREASNSDLEQHRQFYYFLPDIYIDEYTDERDIPLINGLMKKFVADIKSVIMYKNMPPEILKLLKKMETATTIVLQGEGTCPVSTDEPVLQFPRQCRSLCMKDVMIGSAVEVSLLLTALTVTRSGLPHSGIEQMFSCLRGSSNLKYLHFERLKCSDHGDSCCLPALDLQKHHSLREAKLKELSAESVLLPGHSLGEVQLYQVHVRSVLELLPGQSLGTVELEELSADIIRLPNLSTILLHLKNITLSHKGIQQLFACLRGPSKLKYLYLERLKCSDDGDYCRAPGVDLQRHHSLREAKLKELSAESVLLPGHSLREVQLYQVHVRSVLELLPGQSLGTVELEELSANIIRLPNQLTILLHLKNITLSHSGIEQLFACLRGPSKLKYLHLERLQCNDHGDYCRAPGVDLQKHHSLTEAKLKELSAESVLLPGDSLMKVQLSEVHVRSVLELLPGQSLGTVELKELSAESTRLPDLHLHHTRSRHTDQWKIPLQLISITLSHNGIEQLFSCLPGYSGLQDLHLEKFYCSDHGESCCLPAVDLQRHHSLKSVKLDTLYVESVLLPSQLELQETSELHRIPTLDIVMRSVHMSSQGWRSWIDSLPHLLYNMTAALFHCNIGTDFRSYIHSCSQFSVTAENKFCFLFKSE